MADQNGITGYAMIDGMAFIVNDFCFGFYQETDKAGRATSGVKTHLIEIGIEVLEDKDYTLLFEWAFKADKQLDGSVVFLQDEYNKYREITFEGAYCVGIDNCYTAKSSLLHRTAMVHYANHETIVPSLRGKDFFVRDKPTLLHLKITASKISVANIVHQNPW
jgi:hypothetical protein